MLVNDIIVGLSMKINKIFSDTYKIYDDNVKQGLEKPCFFINWINGEETRQIGIEKRNYLDKLHFDITGFSQNDTRIELNDMADKLYDLEYITLKNGILLRADSMKPEISDGVLHFFLDYKIFIAKEDETSEKMNLYDLNREVKEDG